MKSQSEIEKLAELKLASAYCLLDNGQYDNHNHEQLVLQSGLQSEFDAESEDASFTKKWTVVKKWTEQSRYLCGQEPDMVKEFVHSTNEFCIWIKQHL